jgi:hypothetical protein
MAFSKGDKNINRKGRPKKGQALTDILNYELDQKEGGILYRHKIAKKLIELAEGGDIQAIKYLMDRVEGPVFQKIDLSAKVAGEVKPLSYADRVKDRAEFAQRMREIKGE